MSGVPLIDLCPCEKDLCVPEGDDFSLCFTLKDSAGNAIPIAADDIQFCVTQSVGGAPVFVKTSIAGTHTDSSSGKVCFQFASSDFFTIASQSLTTCARYSVKRIIGGAGGQTRTYLCGNLILRPC